MPGGGGSGGGTTKVKYPGYVNQASKEFIERANSLSRRPWEDYQGDRVADLNGDTLASFDLTRSSTGEWRPTVDQAETLATDAGQSWTDADREAYINPFQKNVTDIAARELLRNEEIARKNRGAAAADAGAWGSPQQAIVEAESDRNLQEQISDTYLKGGAAAWDSALAAFNADRDAKLGSATTLSGLADQQSNLTGTDINRLQTIGAVQQQQRQNELDVEYQTWKEKQDWEWTQLAKGADILGATPYGQQTTSSTGNEKAQIIGSGVTAAAMVAMAAILMSSDRRLKTEITRIGTLRSGLCLYRFRYVWGGPLQIGVMADEVARVAPDAVSIDTFGYAKVNYASPAVIQ